PMFGACDLAQLHRHTERRQGRRRLIRWERLLLRLTLSLHREVEGKSSGLLSGDMLHWFGSALLGLRSRRSFQRKDHLSHFYLVAFFNPDVLDYTSHRRRHFH